jgi:hypothetical protein
MLYIQCTSSIHAPVRNINILTQDFRSLSLPTQAMIYSGSCSDCASEIAFCLNRIFEKVCDQCFWCCPPCQSFETLELGPHSQCISTSCSTVGLLFAVNTEVALSSILSHKMAVHTPRWYCFKQNNFLNCVVAEVGLWTVCKIFKKTYALSFGMFRIKVFEVTESMKLKQPRKSRLLHFHAYFRSFFPYTCRDLCPCIYKRVAYVEM